MKKILMISSTGGHFNELKQLDALKEKYQLIYITEDKIEHDEVKYYMKYGTRSELKEYSKILLNNTKLAHKILKDEKPDLIISTGAHTCVPFFILAKKFKVKTIYIESFAKVSSPSLTYKIIKPFCNRVLVQHEKMLEIYPKAEYIGGVF